MTRIKSLTAHPLRLPLKNPLATSKRAYPVLDNVFVRLLTEDGAEGWGEARDCSHITGETQAAIVGAIEGLLAPALHGRDPFDIAGAHRAMDRALAGNPSAKSAVDMALHDVAARIAGISVSQLLGGAPRGAVASSKAVSVGTTATMVDQARAYVADGFATLKIKTGVDEAAELAAVAAIREAVGPAIKLKLDANQGWALQEATRFLAAVERHDIEMVEQPLPVWDFAGHAELRRRTPIPVMLDESIHGPRDVLRAIDVGAADYVNIKLLKTGGLAPARELAALAEAAGITCQIGTLDSSIGSAAALHLVHACGAIRFAEINGPSRLAADIATGFTIENGKADVAAGPGFGLTVDQAAIMGTTR